MGAVWPQRSAGRWVGALLALTALATPALAAKRGGNELQLTSDEFKRLDTFEAHTLGKADKVFGAKDYKRAAAEYDSFLLEFPRSKALSYALLRKARCLQLAGKRYEAVREYQEVLDYFPNTVKFAAAALFYIGESHWENGDEDKAVKAWAKMAEDTEYSKHYLAATALNRLADHLAKTGHAEKAVEYYAQVAVDFRRTNQAAAREAIAKVVRHYVRAQPDEAKLRDFYKKVGTFHGGERRVDADLDKSRDYWQHIRQLVRRNGSFTEAETELRTRYYRYWAERMAGKFLDWDDYQLDIAAFHLAHERDSAKWIQRVDEQFKRNQKDGDYGRIVRWCGLFAHHKAKLMEYYNTLKFEKMTNRQIQDLMAILYDRAKNPQMGENAFGKIRLGDMSDGEKTGLAHYLYHKDGLLVRDVCETFEDAEVGQVELLRYYHWAKDAKKGVPLATTVSGFPRYAQEALFKKGDLLHGIKKYKEAIAAYQQADNPPTNLWAIADCYARMGQLSQAVGQLREVEAFFKNHAPEAALRIARLYKGAKEEKLCIAAFRAVLRKYPKSGQSSAAHQELEHMGIKIGGGVDAN